MIMIVNGLPEKLVEMDEQVTIIKQMNEDAGSVSLRLYLKTAGSQTKIDIFKILLEK